MTANERMIERKLRRAWRRQRRYCHLRGLARVLIWAITLAALDFLVDWLFIFRFRWSGQWRVPMLAANACVLLWAVYYEWLRHLRRFDDLRIALQIEHKHPELVSLLVSYVQLRNADQPAISRTLLDAMRHSALDRIGPLDFREIVNFGQLRRPLTFALFALLILAAAGVNWPRHIEALVLRMAGGNVGYPTQTRIVSVTGNRTIRQGDGVTLAAGVAGRVPQKGEILVRPRGDPEWHSLSLSAGPGAEFSRHIGDLVADADYYFSVGDDRTAEFRVTVVPPPRLVERRVLIAYPAYTGLKDRVVDDLDVEVPEGSRLSWELRCEPQVRAAFMITEGADPMPMELQPDGLGLRHSLPAGADFKYSFRLVDAAHGFAYDDVWRLVRVISDNVPEVKLLEPAGDGPATIRKKLRLVVRATDDYELSKIRLSCSVNGSQDTKHVLGPLKGRQIEAAFDWTPGTATPDLKDGDVVTVAVEVCDARDETDSRWGRSAERRLSICSDAAYLRWLADELDEQRAGIHEAWAEEQTALSAIRQIKGQEMPAKAEQGGK